MSPSVKLDDLREQAARAQRVPGRLNAFLRLRLNAPTQASSRWLSRAVWDANAALPSRQPEPPAMPVWILPPCAT